MTMLQMIVTDLRRVHEGTPGSGSYRSTEDTERELEADQAWPAGYQMVHTVLFS